MESSRINEKRVNFLDPNYKQIVVQYQGDIAGEIARKPGYYLTLINERYAIISLPRNENIKLGDKDFKSIVFIKESAFYGLQSISPLITSEIIYAQIEGNPLYLTGKGVTVGIIDTGIDYLNEEFMDKDGKSRISLIWDQTIYEEKLDGTVPVGVIYSKDEINKAIEAYKKGEDPYKIVPSKDENGHGTSMTGIIGGTGKNPEFKGAAPDCDILAIKLLEAKTEMASGNFTVPLYSLAFVLIAINYLVEYSIKNRKPMVIYLPLGNSGGNHKGAGLLEDYLDSIAINSGIVVVAGTGNEGAAGGHTSGTISMIGESKTVPLYISEAQKILPVFVWIDSPNIMTLDIISPSGETTGSIPIIVNSQETYTFIFEQTKVSVNYSLPEEYSGDELISILFENLQLGTWNLRLTGISIMNGRYNIWLPIQGITLGDTKFLAPDPYGTMTNPGTSSSVVTVACYNQNNNNLVNSSGWALSYDYIDRIDVAAGGIDVKAIAPNNKVRVVNGTSVSAAVVAGACALLFEWGIVNGNSPHMYAQTVKTYLTRGTYKYSEEIYPNPRVGYGFLKMLGVFEFMK